MSKVFAGFPLSKVVIAALIGLLLAVAISVILPIAFFQGHIAAQRARIISLVDAVVVAELDAHRQGAQFMAISFKDDISGVVFNVSDDAVLDDYAIEAIAVDNEYLRIQAWPRPSALAERSAAPVSYYVDISTTGEIVRRGWLPKSLSIKAENS